VSHAITNELFADLETFSDIDLKKCGTHVYATRAEVMLFAYAIGEGEPKCWDLTTFEPMPDDLREALEDQERRTVWHNGGMFDLTVLNAVGQLYDIPPLPHSRVFDTMACAYAHSLPGSLDTLCAVLNIGADKAKHKEGKALVQLFGKPRPKKTKLRRATRETHPEEWQRFIDYAKADITSMREVYRKVPRWNYRGFEYELWLLDQKINARGVAVDRALARGAVLAAERAKDVLASRAQVLTEGAVQATTQRDKLLEHLLESYGVSLPDLQMDTIERRLNDPDLPEALRELLANRLQASTTSVSKYNTLLRCTSEDGRLRGLLQFDGAARTGRWSGRMFQPQNLKRPDMKQKDIEFGIEVIKSEACEFFYDDVMQVVSNAVRGCIIAPPGRKLVVADLSNIEGRKAAWVAAEEWKLKYFRDFDAGLIEFDNYVMAYSKAFNVSPEVVIDNKKNSDGTMRQIGKVCLAKGTLVLVQSGWKPIEAVTARDKLWDGVEWVSHQGLLSQGVRPVISLASLWLTKDHLLLCGTEWKEAQQLREDDTALHRALATAEELSPSQAISLARLVGSTPFSSPATADALSTALSCTTSEEGEAADALSAGKKRQEKDGGRMPKRCRKQSIAFDCSTDSRQRACAALQNAILGGATTAPGGSKCAPNGSLIARLFCGMFAPLMVGITRSLKWIARIPTADMNPEISASSPSIKTTSTGEQCAISKLRLTPCEKKMPTFDLACAGPRKRFTVLTARGPVIVHNCELMLQYEGGVGAFVTGAETYRIDLDDMTAKALPLLPEDTVKESRDFLKWTLKQRRTTYGLPDDVYVVCNSLKSLWRAAHPAISSYWKELQQGFISAVNHPGEWFPVRRVAFRKDGAWLRIRLPSGRFLCYPQPQVDDSGSCSYMGMNQYTRQWQRLGTYGGKLFENICQASARDNMAHAMPIAEEKGYEVVLTVHDELITEAPDDLDHSVDGLAGIMAMVPPWAEGLPLAAAGFEAYRYRKE
jgi:hypothetical protein